MAFISLAIIALVAFASPFIASAIPGKPVPETVFLLVFGAVLLVLLLVVCYACNTANPMRTGSWIPFLD